MPNENKVPEHEVAITRPEPRWEIGECPPNKACSTEPGIGPGKWVCPKGWKHESVNSYNGLGWCVAITRSE